MGFGSFLKNGICGVARLMGEVRDSYRGPDKHVFGSSGMRLFGDYIREEYLGALQDLRSRCQVFDEMRKSEPVIHLSLKCYEDPILSALRDVVLPEVDEHGDSPEDSNEELNEAVLQHVKANLFQTMDRPFAALLREMLSCLQYGFSVFEIIWEKRDGLWLVKDMLFLHQRTIVWQFDKETNALLGVKQVTDSGSPDSTREMIPREKLLIFSMDKIGDNWEGVGMPRHAYRAWKSKNLLMQMLVVGFERFLVKTPMLRAPFRTGGKDAEDIHNILKNWRSSEVSGGIIPFGWEWIDTADNFGGGMAAMRYIEFLNREMFWACMTHWAQLGIDGSGSLALSRDQTDFFNMALRAVINNICDEINYRLIPQMVKYNFPSTTYPELSFTLSDEDVKARVENILAVVNGGILPTYPALKEKMVQMLDLPEMPEDMLGEPQGEIPGEDPGEDGPEDPPDGPKKDSFPPGGGKLTKSESGGLEGQMAEPGFWRDLTEHEKRAGGARVLREKQNYMKQKTKDFRDRVSPLMLKMAEGFINSAKGKKLPDALKLEVPKQNEYREIVERFLFDVARDSMERTIKETGGGQDVESKKAVVNRFKAWAAEKALLVADSGAHQIKAFLLSKGTDNFEKGVDNEIMVEVLVKRTFTLMKEAFQGMGKEHVISDHVR